jgi:hypothetical protein
LFKERSRGIGLPRSKLLPISRVYYEQTNEEETERYWRSLYFVNSSHTSFDSTTHELRIHDLLATSKSTTPPTPGKSLTEILFNKPITTDDMASNAGDSLVPARDTRNWQSANAGALSDHCVRRGIFEKPPVGTKLPATTMMKALIMCWEWDMFNEDGTMDDRTARLVEGWFKLSNNGQVEGLLKDNGLVAGEGVNK